MTILYSGGGTLGSVSPLLAVHAECKAGAKRGDAYRGVWIGLDLPKERAFISGRGFEEFSIVSPRFRNFEGQGMSFTFLTFPFRLLWGFFQALRVIRETRPNVHVSAGSFVSIPVALACFVSGVPNVVHQQDLLPGLANKVMARLATRVTVAFPILAAAFPGKSVVTGNPVREEVLHGSAEVARALFGLREGLPTVFVIGGSSGAQGLNDIVEAIASRLLERANVLHMTGQKTDLEPAKQGVLSVESGKGVYTSVPFFGPEIADAYQLADVVVARAGLSTISELGVLGKPMILVPGPLHQNNNAEYFEREGAAMVVRQDEGAEALLGAIEVLLEVPGKGEKLSAAGKRLFPRDAAKRIVAEIKNVRTPI